MLWGAKPLPPLATGMTGKCTKRNQIRHTGPMWSKEVRRSHNQRRKRRLILLHRWNLWSEGSGFHNQKALKTHDRRDSWNFRKNSGTKISHEILYNKSHTNYFPIEASRDEELEKFYNELEQSTNRHGLQKNFIIGDMNSKVGTRSHEDEEPVGLHSIGVRNRRGGRLIQFGQEYRLKITNTFFHCKDIH